MAARAYWKGSLKLSLCPVRLALLFSAVRRSPNKARMHSLRRAIERDSPAFSAYGPLARATRADRSPRQPAAKEQIRYPPLARRWRRIRAAASVSQAARRVVANPAVGHAEWLPRGLFPSIRVLPSSEGRARSDRHASRDYQRLWPRIPATAAACWRREHRP